AAILTFFFLMRNGLCRCGRALQLARLASSGESLSCRLTVLRRPLSIFIACATDKRQTGAAPAPARAGSYWMVSISRIAWLADPLEPVIVTPNVPRLAPCPVLIVSVEGAPAVVAVTGFVLK